MEELRALVSVINDSARVLEESCYERDLPLPGLNTPYDVQHEEAMSADPNSLKASADIIAAAGQLTALIQSPPLHLTTIALQVSRRFGYGLFKSLTYITRSTICARQ